jgi:hypothetical protein
LYCQGYTYEQEPHDITKAVFENRKEITKKSAIIHLYGKLAVDICSCEKLLLPNIEVRIVLFRSQPNFCLIGDDATKGYRVKINTASLLVRKMSVASSIYNSLKRAHEKNPARYVYSESRGKTFIIPGGQNLFIRENIFNNEPIRRLVIAMNTNADFTGALTTNPFHYQKFGLREVKIIRNGIPLVSLNTQNDVYAYRTTLKSLNFTHDGPNIFLEDYPNHYILVFDLTSTAESTMDVIYPELGGAIRIELYFDTGLTDATELLLLGERLSTIYIDKDNKVVKDG